MALIHPWHDVSLGKDAPKIVQAIVEIPFRTSVKYELDKESGLLRLDRHMHSAVHYPADYGFLPQTYCDDKDPLDVLILTNQPTQSLALCEVKVIGAFKMSDDGEQDDKIIGVHAHDPHYKEWNSIKDIPKHYLKEIQHFFETYKQLKGGNVKITKVLDVKDAYKIIADAQKLYQKNFKKGKE